MVTHIQVICERGEDIIERQYVQPHKTSAILTYLRLLKCGSRAQTDPEQLTGDHFEIILYNSSGERSIYRQRANRYFSKNSGAWVKILPEQAGLLYPLILAMPGD